jgi:AcrR family transcriptional regulator
LERVPVLAPAGPGIPAWQWGKTEQTQQALLAAACEVFAEQGYAAAKMTEIAGRAGLSVGSIYHHFGGKGDLYLALWRRYHLAREEAAARAVARARHAGITDNAGLWAAGARAALRAAWKRRDLAALFCARDGPPDFEGMRQHRSSSPGRHGDALLSLSDDARGGLYAAVLAALLSEGTKGIVAARTRQQAEAVIDDVLEYASRLMAGGPASGTPRAAAETPARPEASAQVAPAETGGTS